MSSAMRKKKYHTRLMEEIAREGAEAQGVLRRVEKMGNVRFFFFFFFWCFLCYTSILFIFL